MVRRIRSWSRPSTSRFGTFRAWFTPKGTRFAAHAFHALAEEIGEFHSVRKYDRDGSPWDDKYHRFTIPEAEEFSRRLAAMLDEHAKELNEVGWPLNYTEDGQQIPNRGGFNARRKGWVLELRYPKDAQINERVRAIGGKWSGRPDMCYRLGPDYWARAVKLFAEVADQYQQRFPVVALRVKQHAEAQERNRQFQQRFTKVS